MNINTDILGIDLTKCPHAFKLFPLVNVVPAC
jgi:hypothetical protein